MNKIEVRNLVKRYNKHIALDDISLVIDTGDVVGIIGENGAGKSTLMSMLVTMSKPNSGDILYNDESVVNNPRIVRGKVGYVPQDIALYEDLTGFDNLKFWAKTYHIAKNDISERLDSIKKIIGLKDEVLKKKVKTYSGGMKRRVNIAVALLNNPDVIVMDEPTVGIDIASKADILDVIKQLNKEGKTIIYASHYLDEIEEICNKVCIMKSGKIIDYRNIQDIFNDESMTFKQYYLEKNRCS